MGEAKNVKYYNYNFSKSLFNLVAKLRGFGVLGFWGDVYKRQLHIFGSVTWNPITFNMDTLGPISGMSLFISDSAMLDTEGKFIRVNSQDIIHFGGTLENTNTYEYSINTWMFSYDKDFNMVPFCVPLIANLVSGGVQGDHNITCWGSAVNFGTYLKLSFGWRSQHLEVFTVEKHITPFNDSMGGYQFYSFQYTASVVGQFAPTAGQVKAAFWNSGGTVSIVNLDQTSTFHRHSNAHTIGSMDFGGGAMVYTLKGFVDKLQIYYSLNDGSPGPKAAAVANLKNNYVVKFQMGDSSKNDISGGKLLR